MAYRGESSEILTVVAAASVAEVVTTKPTVDARDLRMVRIALGMIAVLAVANAALYLPRLF